MPVDSGFNRQIVLNENLQVISLFNINHWPRLLPVDEIDFSGKAIFSRKKSVDGTGR
jgi:hypothetical protein